MASKPAKPYMPIPDLVKRLESLGMQVDGEAPGEYLKKVGYHRLGGYRYVFREMLPLEEQDLDARRFRLDQYYPGSRLSEVRSLEQWDGKLRMVVLQGCSELEIRLRAAIAQVVARRDPYGYLEESNLNQSACATKVNKGTKLEGLRNTVAEAERIAANEDFIIHHKVSFPGVTLPIWALVDILSLGSLPYLLDLLKTEDGNEIAGQFGVRNGNSLATWLRAVADLRNVCAHNSRLFNRSMKRSIRVKSRDVDPKGPLGHLVNESTDWAGRDPGKKLYSVVAVLAHLLRSNESDVQWPRTLTTHMKKFPNREFPGSDLPSLSIVASCGFPSAWRELDLWTYEQRRSTTPH